MNLNQAKEELKKYSNKEKAKILQRFFKTGRGEYGEGDIFLGVVVPDIRKVAKQYRSLNREETISLLKSPFHEERMLALLILVQQYTQGAAAAKKEVYESYLNHTRYINNWDMVDLTAGRIVGAYLMDKNKKILYTLAKSNMLWERRIAIISTSHFIANHSFDDTLKIAKILLSDKEDLIHKAAGWMLREVGKRDLKAEEEFLKKHYPRMPRTMLRYAIEKFPERKRQRYLKGVI